MRSYKFIFALFLVLFAFQGVNALEIGAEEAIPAGTQWTANINYSLDVSEELNIYLDDELIFSAFNKASNIFVDEKKKSLNVLAYNIDSEKLVLSVAGMSEGQKIISARILSDLDEIDYEETKIIFYGKSVLDNKISSLELMVSTLTQDLNSKQEQINTLNSSEKQFIESLSKINSELFSLRQESNIKQESIEKIGSDLNLLIIEREKQVNPLSGLFAFGSSSPMAIGTIFLLILIVIGIVLFTKKQEVSLYNK